jgi:tetratricopeptide (TPR) repeat protein
LVLLAVPLVAYIPSLHAGFLWDDRFLLTENPLMRLHDGLARLWFSTQNYDYYPVTYSSFWVEWRLWGLNPAGYHVFNIVLHAANGLLLWRVLARLKIPGAWFAALLFAIHPVNAASVGWIAERKNTLSMLFYLAASLCFLRHEASRNKSSYAAALVFCILALLSKTSVVMLPAVLLLCAWWQRGRMTRTDLLRTAPFFLLSLVAGLVTIWFQSHNVINEETISMGDWPTRVVRAGWAAAFYAGKLLYPSKLSLLYPCWEVGWEPAWILPGTGLLALLLSAWMFRGTWGRALLFGIGYFVLSLLPVLGFVKMYYFRLSPVADHWLYIPGIGILALAVSGAWTFAQRFHVENIAKVIAAGVVALLGILTWQRAVVLQTPETLWADVLSKDPGSVTALVNLSLDSLSRGLRAQSLGYARRAVAIAPHSIESRLNLGAILDANSLVPESVAAYESAVRLQPRHAAAHHELAIAWNSAGDSERALKEYESAVELRGDDFQYRIDLGSQLFHLTRYGEAAKQFQAAINLDPTSANAHANLGASLHSLGYPREAASAYREALRLEPGHPNARQNLDALLSTNPGS